MSAVPKSPFVNPEEYLVRERTSSERHEYFRGEMFAMSGVSYEHSLISTNILGRLHHDLRGRNCAVHGSDMRVKVSSTGLYTYPDVSVVCGNPQFDDSHVDTLLNPIVIVEVLSPSTEAYDRGVKSSQYRRLESLQEYVLVSQERVCVERFVRQGDEWLLRESSSLDDSLRLDSINCTITLRDIYERVEFTPSSVSNPAGLL